MNADKAPEAPKKQRSRVTLVVALLVMLVPALIPLYFAFALDEHTLVFIAAALLLAIFNVLIVTALWNWLGAQNSQDSSSSEG